MKLLACLGVVFCVLFFPVSGLPTQERGRLEIVELDGGSVVTTLSPTIKVNDGSTLRRRTVALNDPTCPIQLRGGAVSTFYRAARISGHYEFESLGLMTALEDVRAFEIRYVLVDVFGAHLRTLSFVRVLDLESGKTVAVEPGQWRASENDVTRYFASVAFVAQVRRASGIVWKADYQEILREIGRFQFSVREGDLAPAPERAEVGARTI
jgi:hypothetical protein